MVFLLGRNFDGYRLRGFKEELNVNVNGHSERWKN
jgi:hypothetical protein